MKCICCFSENIKEYPTVIEDKDLGSLDAIAYECLDCGEIEYELKLDNKLSNLHTIAMEI